METTLFGTDVTVIARILLAAACAVPIGLEREIKGKAAGVRTHVVLAACAAGLGWLSVEAAEGDRSADPTRIASYTVAGISFLGGGLIVGVQTRVHGLTTAVAAFTMTSIGLLSGMGYPLAAVGLTVVTLLSLAPLDWLKTISYGALVREEATLHVVTDSPEQLSSVQEALTEIVELRAISLSYAGDGQCLLQVTVRGKDDEIQRAEEMLDAVQGVVGVGTVRG